jgi:heptaprenyl diphosphate synthase
MLFSHNVTLMNAAALLSLPYVSDGLTRLEPLLRDTVGSGDGFLDEVATHLIDAGGKRLRPALAIAAATLGHRPATTDELRAGIAVELVHLGSLYHDDVMDEAVTRRNVDSVNARFGNLVAIVAGDYLLAKSAEIAASLGAEIAGLLATTLARLCEGQLAEVRSAYSAERTEAQYVAAIDGKTAALMATSCRIGALAAGMERAHVDALTEFGRNFGLLFQLRDDILDIIGSEDVLGKRAGQDLTEGVYTLPVLVALADSDSGPELRSLLGKPLGEPEREKARAIVSASRGIETTRELGQRFVRAAAEAASFVGPPVGPALTELAGSTLDGLFVS